jgi:glycerophosphoryl diester phosphodiesterase
MENGQQIPTLAEIFDLINRNCFVNVELKGSGTAKPVLALIGKYIAENNWRYEDFVISSFDWNMLQEIHHSNPKIRVGVLTLTDLELAIGYAGFIHAYSIHPYFHLLTEENTAAMQQKGFLVFPWTVNEPEDIQKIKAFRVNGIITDYPDRL